MPSSSHLALISSTVRKVVNWLRHLHRIKVRNRSGLLIRAVWWTQQFSNQCWKDQSWSHLSRNLRAISLCEHFRDNNLTPNLWWAKTVTPPRQKKTCIRSARGHWHRDGRQAHCCSSRTFTCRRRDARINTPPTSTLHPVKFENVVYSNIIIKMISL